MPPFRDDHILIIQPGSTTTLAQLGLPESYTPAKVRVPSRMFPGVDENTWLPNKIQELQQGETMIVGDQQEVVTAGAKKKKGRPPKRKKGKDKEKEGGAAKDDQVTKKDAPPAAADASANGSVTAPAPKDDQVNGTAVPPIKEESPAVKGETSAAADKPAETSTDASAAKDSADKGDAKGDTTMTDADTNANAGGEEEGEGEDGDEEEAADEDIDDTLNDGEEDGEDEKYYYEDEDDEEGAIWCMKEGRIVDWGCFFALLTHVYEVVNPTFHTPVLIVSQPCWTMSDKERITQFVFEKLKSPGFTLMDSAQAACWAYAVSSSTVIDVGYEKTDITPVVEHVVQDLARTTIPTGGNHMNTHLQKLLPSLTEDEIETLKRSTICEILPPGVPIPGEKPPTPKDDMMVDGNPVTVGMGSRGKNLEQDAEEEVMNVAEIVASGKTQEFLAKKEKEKAEKNKGQQQQGEKKLPNHKKEKNTFVFVERNTDELYNEHEGDKMDVDGETNDNTATTEGETSKPAETTENALDEAQKPVQSPPTAMDVSTDDKPADEAQPKPVEPSSGDDDAAKKPEGSSSEAMQTDKPEGNTESKENGGPASAPAAAETATSGNGTVAPPTDSSKEGDEAGKAPEANMSVFPTQQEMEDEDRRTREKAAARKEEKKRQKEADLTPGMLRREIEVGVERFKAAEGGILHIIADAVYRSICKVDELGKRSDCWETVIIIGNGSKLRGFKEALVHTLISKYLVSPVSSTIFTSELPSNISTPIGTGANTPAPQFANTPGGASHPPNPLLLAAATNSAALAAAARDQQQQQQSSHHSSHHSQNPTSIKTAKFPEYFPMWKEAGPEECTFLGAQVAAKVIFVVDQGTTGGFLTRVEYNERGPKAVHSL